MADEKVMQNIAESEVQYDDAALAAAYLEKRKQQHAEDFAKPYDPECILEVRHLRKCFPMKKTMTGKVTKELVAVDDVSFKLHAGETLGIVGESGCGKTTAGRAILKLHQPTGGQIIFDGKDITNYTPKQMREIRKEMQIIFQDPYSSLPPRDTVGGLLSEPVQVHKLVPKNEIRDYVLKLMTSVVCVTTTSSVIPTNSPAVSVSESVSLVLCPSILSWLSVTSPFPLWTCPFRHRSSTC